MQQAGQLDYSGGVEILYNHTPPEPYLLRLEDRSAPKRGSLARFEQDAVLKTKSIYG